MDSDEFPIKEMRGRGCAITYEEGSTCLLVLMVATRKEYRQQGRATRLLGYFIQHAQKTGKSIDWGAFTPEGELYLKHVIERLTELPLQIES